jgi:predicted Zn finger-like uncharacterized protein
MHSVVVQCPSCQTRFRIADEKVTDRGVRVRCSNCKDVFSVKKSGAGEAGATSGSTIDLSSLLDLDPPMPPAPPAAKPPASRATPAIGRASQPPSPRAGASSSLDADDLFGMPEPTEEEAPRRVKAGVTSPIATYDDLDLEADDEPLTPPKPKTGPLKTDPPAKPRTGPVAVSEPTKPRTGPVAVGGLAKPKTGPVAAGGLAKPKTGPVAAGEPTKPRTGPVAVGVLAKPKTGPVAVGVLAKPKTGPVAVGVLAKPKTGPVKEPARIPPPPPQDAEEESDLADRLTMDPLEGLGPESLADPKPPAKAKTDKQPKQYRSIFEKPPEPPASAKREVVASAMTGLVGAALAMVVVIVAAFSDEGSSGWLGWAPRSDVVATRVVSGLYDTAAGKPVFYVRGRVENRGNKPHGPVRVIAELVADHGAEAKAEALAGTEPTPEDVYGLRSSADAERLERTLQTAVVERKLAAGASLPFFAVIADPPSDLKRHRLHVRLEPIDAWSPRTAEAIR